MQPRPPTQTMPLSSSNPRSLTCLSTIFAALAASLALLPLLGRRPLAEWDEAIYAEVAREMLSGGWRNWLAPHWNGQVWLEKPPLLMWTTAAFFKIFGVTEFWARAASALSGVAVVALVHAWLLRRNGRLAAWLSTGILLGTFGFLHVCHVGETDVLLSLGCCIALIGLAQADARTPSGWYLFWTGFAVAAMTKGAASIVLPLAALIFAGVQRWRFDRFGRHFAPGLTAFLALILPWHLAMYHRFGHQFLTEYLGLHVLARSTHQIEGHATPWWFFLKVLLVSAPPFVLFYPAALVNGFRRAELRIWAIFAVVVIVFYSLIQTRLPHYIAPAYAPLSLLAAAWLAERLPLLLLQPRPPLRWAAYAAAVAAIAGICVGLTSPARKALHSAIRSDGTTALDNREAIPLLRAVRRQPQPFAGPLLLWRDGPVISTATLVFYSGRTVQQVQPRPAPGGTPLDRYIFQPVPLAEAAGPQPRLILLDRTLLPRIPAEYAYTPILSSATLELGSIQRRGR